MAHQGVLQEVRNVEGNTHCPDHESCSIKIALNEKSIDNLCGIILNNYKTLDTRITKHRDDYLTVAENLQVSITNVVSEIKELKDAVVGTADKKGLKTMIYEHEDFIQPMKMGNQAIINWIYKGSMIAGMFWVISHLK